MRRNRQHQPVAVKALAVGLPAKAWRTITWCQGTNERLTSRFARVRVRTAHRDYWQTTQRLEEWLLIEWPKGEDQPADLPLRTHVMFQFDGDDATAARTRARSNIVEMSLLRNQVRPLHKPSLVTQ
jgi:SRSO17 transposase